LRQLIMSARKASPRWILSGTTNDSNLGQSCKNVV
jgi:hypothetical protein